ncbi:MAG: histidine kinase [Bacteroidota bacterium]
MHFKLTRSDIYLALIFFGISIIIGSMDYANYPEGKLYLLWVDHVNFILFCAVSVYVLIYIIFARFFPTKQFVLLFITGIGWLFIMGILEIQWHCYFRVCEWDGWTMTAIYYALVSHIEGTGIFATFLLGKKLYDAQAHLINIEKEKKESELRLLKSQIDPHFLFNNLNTIDSMIDSNPRGAKVYLNKLSQLYRYLISSKDFEVVPLEEELEFARNYMFLIESRFGDAYQFEILDQTQSTDIQLIPPGALQTLLENIVKHNHGSSIAPIKTNIHITDKEIIITNNIKSKQGKVDSTGIGLTNLKSRYKLLTDSDIQIQSTEHFTVKLPSIKQVA